MSLPIAIGPSFAGRKIVAVEEDQAAAEEDDLKKLRQCQTIMLACV